MTETECQDPPNVVRKFYPAEVAVFVKASRELRNWTQAELAEKAHVEVRTIQRLEASQGVSTDTLRRISRALEIDERFLIKEHEIPSEEEIKRSIEEEEKKYWTLPARELTTADQYLGFLGGIDAYVPGFEPVEGELRQAVAEFLDWSSDTMLWLADASHNDRMQQADSIAPLLRRVQSAGIHLVVAQHVLKLKFAEGRPLIWRAGYVQLLKNVPTDLRIRKDTKFSF